MISIIAWHSRLAATAFSSTIRMLRSAFNVDILSAKSSIEFAFLQVNHAALARVALPSASPAACTTSIHGFTVALLVTSSTSGTAIKTPSNARFV